MTFRALILFSLCFVVGCAAKPSPEQFQASMKEYLSKDENVSSLMEAFRDRALKERERQISGDKDRLDKQFDNPVKVDLGDSPSKGPESAKVTVVEFSDFQCPYCQQGASTMEQLLKAYPSDVRLVFKHMPLPFHPQARSASAAAIAAGRQDKFWEMYGLLFANQKKLSDSLYTDLAKQLGLNLKQFQADMKSEETAAEIQKDQKLAASLGIQGTPAFFVNGVSLKGAYPLEQFKSVVDKWLARIK